MIHDRPFGSHRKEEALHDFFADNPLLPQTLPGDASQQEEAVPYTNLINLWQRVQGRFEATAIETEARERNTMKAGGS